MGKDKRKGKEKGSTFDYYMGSGKIGDMMDRYGVEKASFGGKPGNYGPGDDRGYRSKEDVERDLAKAMMSDYDTRRGMEAAAMSGNKDAKKFAKKGFKAGNIYSAWDTMKDLKKEHVGGGGMNGAKNIAGLTQALVQHDRDTFTQANDAKYASKDDLAALEEQQEEGPSWDDAKEETVLSEEMSAAKERATAWSDSDLGGDVYGASGGEDEQDAAAVTPSDTESYEKGQSYLSNFKENLKAKGKYVPNLA